MKASKTAKAVRPSLSRRLFNMAKQYDDVIDLTLGDPDVQPHDLVKRAACAAIERGDTRYSANAGMPALREEICRVSLHERGVAHDWETEAIVTVGGMGALSLVFGAMLDSGDEVVIIAPYYVNYVQMIRMVGAVPILVNLDPARGFELDLEAVESAVTDKTVAIVVNSPCNPTGIAFSAREVDGLADIARRHDLSVVSDEVYRTLIYDGVAHESIATRPGMRERTVIVDSASKRFAMTGYRLGWALGPTSLIANMVKMQENVSACAPSPSQHAVLEALKELAIDTSFRNVFAERRDLLCGLLDNVPGVSFRKPDGAFYLFADVSATGMDGMSFAMGLLESKHVAVVPGETYGDEYSGFIRIAYTLEKDRLQEACARIRRFVEDMA